MNNPDSDYDLIVVGELSKRQAQKQFPGFDVSVYTPTDFQSLIDSHDISALESIFLPRKSEHGFGFELDLKKLRSTCSAKASNSWVKAKKKLDATSPDYNPYVGKKSAWHAIRIIDFACQIVVHGTIIDYASCNHLYRSILECQDWVEIEMKFKNTYNQTKSKFRLLTPK